MDGGDDPTDGGGERPHCPPNVCFLQPSSWYRSQVQTGREDSASGNEEIGSASGNEEYKNWALITLNGFQRRRISDLLTSLDSSEMARQDPRSHHEHPRPTHDDTDDKFHDAHLSASRKVDDDDVDEDDELEEGFHDVIKNIDESNFDGDEFGERSDSEEEMGDVGVPTKFAFHLKENVGEPPERHDHRPLARDKHLDRLLLNQQKSKTKYLQMMEWRQKLPSFAKKEDILDAISRNQVIVISGDAGCGKTTQVAQYILDSWIEKGDGSLCRVICSQPRHIGVIFIAERVADERVETLGTSVGYQSRLYRKLPRDKGSILYCTTAILLKLLESDPSLAAASHIILDEVHERDVLCDFLMIILRDLIRQRHDLRLIIISDTLGAKMFSEYFDGCPMIHIPGCMFPVQEIFLEDIIKMINFAPDKALHKRRNSQLGRAENEQQKLDEYKQWIDKLDVTKYSQSTKEVLQSLAFNSDDDVNYDLLMVLIQYVASNRPDGAILVFVADFEQVLEVVKRLVVQPYFTPRNFNIIPLHFHLDMLSMGRSYIFGSVPTGRRKIIVTTHIAESSITIEDVTYVIDCGKVLIKTFDATNNLDTLQQESIGRTNARQRQGRAGRVGPGECFRLYTSFHESRFNDFVQPEIHRTRLDELCLKIKVLNLGTIKEYFGKAIQPPSMDSVNLAISSLRALGALTADEELTPLGYHLARLPVDVHCGKMLLFGALFSCLDPILSVVASLSLKDAFYVQLFDAELIARIKELLSWGSNSDHLLMAYVFEGWEKAETSRIRSTFCRLNRVSRNTLQMIEEMRRQLSQSLFDMGFLVSPDPKLVASNQNTGNLNLVKAVVCAGLYPNVVRRGPVKDIHSQSPLPLYTKCGRRVLVHPKSIVFGKQDLPSQCFVYHHSVRAKKVYIYDCTPVSPYSLLFFGGDLTYREDLDQNCLVVDDWLKFGASAQVADLILKLRHQLHKLIEKGFANPRAVDWMAPEEDSLMKVVIELIDSDSVYPKVQQLEF